MFLNTVQCRYNAVNFHPNPHKRHPIAHPWERDMGCLLWMGCLWCIICLPQSLPNHMQNHVMLDHALTALDCNLFCEIWTEASNFWQQKTTNLGSKKKVIKVGSYFMISKSSCISIEWVHWHPFPNVVILYPLILFVECYRLTVSTSEVGSSWIHEYWILTHWGRVTHICVSKLTTIGSDNGLSPGRRQAII